MKAYYIILCILFVSAVYSCYSKDLKSEKKESEVKAALVVKEKKSSKSSDYNVSDEYHDLILDTIIIHKKDTFSIRTYKKTSFAWNGAPGAIVVSNGCLKDTLFDGCSGFAPDFRFISHQEKSYLELSSTIMGGGNNFESITLLSLEKYNFLDTLFTEDISISSERTTEDGYFETCHKDLDISYIENEMIIEIDSICKNLDSDSYKLIDTSGAGKRFIKTDLTLPEVKISEWFGEDCHMCPGGLIIQKGKKLDTLFCGSWGQPVKNWFHSKDDCGHKITLLGSYSSGGTNEHSIKMISLNSGNYLNPILDTIISDRWTSQSIVERFSVELGENNQLWLKQTSISYHTHDEGHDTIAEVTRPFIY